LRIRSKRLKAVSAKERVHMYQASQIAELRLIVGFAAAGSGLDQLLLIT
jgi:hypothetical protein